ncbi:hypothetical protein ES319_D05G289100v1 [Gossypium barbadense]|uniref:Major facilitator superfamily (MFS) profile domain-containing protein n=1 Tax=Gossypium barbadense TaxID=3634 RepID=A0A5J5RK36_GOSBA|nr:hypothetical protein ES319_D05G289100v1 [Gossypium barbadense]
MGPLGESTATAAVQVNTWSGVVSLLSLLGVFVADTFLGQCRTIILASLLYILGLSLLTLSAVLPSLNTYGCQKADTSILCLSPELQVMIFFFSLDLVAFGQGGHKPCVQAFGADQFNAQDPEEFKAKSSFLNWWYFGLCSGTLISFLVLNYIQDNLSWVLGFGIPCIIMVFALIVFLCGTTTYRYSVKRYEKSPFLRIGQVFVLVVRNWRTSSVVAQKKAHGTLPLASSKQYEFLNKALLAPDGSKEHGNVCSIEKVEEAKVVLRLVPIWATCLVYAVVLAQSSTFFTKQGATMDRSITVSVKIPAASLQSFISLTIVLSIPIYDCIFVPLVRTWTRKSAGMTMLQRIRTGMFLSSISMILVALVEMKRLKTIQEYGLVDKPEVTVPMSMLTMVGLQKFFYDQVPNELRSIGLALYLSIFGVGSFLSGFLISAIDKATGGNGGESWFLNNLNKAHIYSFYWLLAALSALELALYLYFAKKYIYK